MSDPQDGFEVVAEYPDATTSTYPDIAQHEAEGVWVRFVQESGVFHAYTSDEPVGPWTDRGALPSGVGGRAAYVNGVWFATGDYLVRSTDLVTWTKVTFSGFTTGFQGDSGVDPTTDYHLVAELPWYSSGRWWAVVRRSAPNTSETDAVALFVASSASLTSAWQGDEDTPVLEPSGTDTSFIIAPRYSGDNGDNVWVYAMGATSLDGYFAHAATPNGSWSSTTISGGADWHISGNGYWVRLESADNIQYDYFFSTDTAPGGSETAISLDADYLGGIARFEDGVFLISGTKDDAIVVFAGDTPESLALVDFEITASPAYLYEELTRTRPTGWLLSAYSDPDATLYYLTPGGGGGDGWGVLLS